MATSSTQGDEFLIRNVSLDINLYTPLFISLQEQV
jgi:hypothetical protein